MNNGQDVGNAAQELYSHEEVEGVLSGSFYSAPPASTTRAKTTSDVAPKSTKEKPTHYKVICISMYTDALAQLDGMVSELKSRGYTKANRSALIRHALACVDLDQVPRGL